LLARFQAERQNLASLDHPCIAKVFDAGQAGSGCPYFAMELVEGNHITRYCDEEHLSIRERLELFIQVCHALQHAHQKRIIHCDLKPANILASKVDGKGMPKVIDFGLAVAAETATGKKVRPLISGQKAGTPAYMSPEQALGESDLDTQTDIYSLGAVLWE